MQERIAVAEQFKGNVQTVPLNSSKRLDNVQSRVTAYILNCNVCVIYIAHCWAKINFEAYGKKLICNHVVFIAKERINTTWCLTPCEKLSWNLVWWQTPAVLVQGRDVETGNQECNASLANTETTTIGWVHLLTFWLHRTLTVTHFWNLIFDQEGHIGKGLHWSLWWQKSSTNLNRTLYNY